ncbi:MAG: cation diffusion facilitator family transporter [Planctomycetota bacterium]|jgi:cation diffusion facilitator family transporter
MAVGDSKKVVVAALVGNFVIAVAKGIAAFVTGSGAMLAETIHSLADSGNQGLLLYGDTRGKRPPDARHPFGYGSERYFWAFIVALVLFSLGSLFSIYEGIHKLQHPEKIRSVWWALGVLGFAAAVELKVFIVARREVKKIAGDVGFWTYFSKSKDPALPLVYLEDLGALLGLLFALVGIVASYWGGWVYADGLATLAIGVLLGGVAAVLLRRCHRLLIGEGASDEDGRKILEVVQAHDGIGEVIELKTLQIGPQSLLVGLEVRVTGDLKATDTLEEAIRAAVPTAKYIAVEPYVD